MPEIYLKFLQNNLFKFKNLFENVRFSASKRRYPCLLWGALAYFAEKKIKNPSTIFKMKHPRCQKYIWNFSKILSSNWKTRLKTSDFRRQSDDVCLLVGVVGWYHIHSFTDFPPSVSPINRPWWDQPSGQAGSVGAALHACEDQAFIAFTVQW